jgi:hypothetical protein
MIQKIFLIIKNKINEVCKTLNIKCINLPNYHQKNNIKHPSYRSAESLNYILRYQLEYQDKYFILDSECF